MLMANFNRQKAATQLGYIQVEPPSQVTPSSDQTHVEHGGLNT
jgi:hypothetical protein